MKHSFIKRAACIGLSALLFCTASACGTSSGEEVPVQSVASITGIGSIGLFNKFAGVVVSGDEQKIKVDEKMTIDEILVEVGDIVNVGDVLFTYDTEAISLTLEQSELEIEGMNNSIATYTNQIAELEKQKEEAEDSEILSYTLEIQRLQTQIKETQYNISLKQKELDRQKDAVKESEVYAPVTGTVTAINENGGYDNYGNPLPFMTVTETANLRIKGVINELNRGSIFEGTAMTIRSRTDDSITWSGWVEKIDYETSIQNNNNYYYDAGGNDEFSNSTKNPFYVSLDNSDGLFLGQHVYIEPFIEEAKNDGINLPTYYINDLDGKPWVWADNGKGKLEKRTLELGQINDFDGTALVISGLTPDDSIAFPSDDYKEGMTTAVVSADDFYTPVAGGYDDFGYSDNMGSYDMPVEDFAVSDMPVAVPEG